MHRRIDPLNPAMVGYENRIKETRKYKKIRRMGNWQGKVMARGRRWTGRSTPGERIRSSWGALHDHTAASLLLGRIGVFAFVDLARISIDSDPTEEESHTWPHTEGAIKSRVLLQ